jgi:transmembrane protein TMEM260 (protein O-mannosyltransferase)
MEQPKEASSPVSRIDILSATSIGIATLALYIRTLAPSLLWGDPAEFQTLSYTLGMSHPSGYMTQIVIGKLFTYIPVGNIAYRANLMSAFFGALTVAQVYLIVRLLGGRRIAAVSACMMLAFAPLFWWCALVAESYAPASGMITTVWLCVLLWRRTGNWIYLFIAGITGGISLGIHSTAGMTAASVLVTMIFAARKRTDWFGAAGGGLVGLILLISFFWLLDHKDPPSSIYNTVYRTNFSAMGLSASQFDTPVERFLTVFPVGHFWSFFFTATPQEIQRRLVEYITYYPIWAPALILTGVAVLFRRNWRDALYPLVAFLLIWGFAVTVEFSVYHDFYASAAIFAYVWLGVGASALLDLIERAFHGNSTLLRSAYGIVSVLLIVLPIWHARADLRPAILNGYTSFVREMHLYPVFAKDKAIQDALKIVDRVESNAIVFTDWDKLYSYVYTAQIVKHEPGIAFHEVWYTDELKLSDTTLSYIDDNIDSRPIYFAIEIPGLEDHYHVVKINDTLQRIYRK